MLYFFKHLTVAILRSYDSRLWGFQSSSGILNCLFCFGTEDFSFFPQPITDQWGKTTEITELQIGDSSSPVNLVASTVSEVEHLVDYLVRCKSQGRQVNVRIHQHLCHF